MCDAILWAYHNSETEFSIMICWILLFGKIGGWLWGICMASTMPTVYLHHNIILVKNTKQFQGSEICWWCGSLNDLTLKVKCKFGVV